MSELKQSETPISDGSRVHSVDIAAYQYGDERSPYCRYEDMQKLERQNHKLEKERDQWKACAKKLKFWLAIYHGVYTPDQNVIESIAAFDKLNTP